MNSMPVATTATARRDTLKPVINVANLQLAPAQNAITQTPYPISGSISDANLAGLSANQQSIGVLPAGGNSYSFRFDAVLTRGE
jgi:hypothetical protein